MRELMRRFNGQTVPEEVFQTQSVVTLPVFQEVRKEVSQDGQIELDAIGEGQERWVVEVKWRNKRTGRKELEKLYQHARARNASAWFVSGSGFSTDAIQYALENGILITGRDGLETLRKLIR